MWANELIRRFSTRGMYNNFLNIFFLLAFVVCISFINTFVSVLRHRWYCPMRFLIFWLLSLARYYHYTNLLMISKKIDFYGYQGRIYIENRILPKSYHPWFPELCSKDAGNCAFPFQRLIHSIGHRPVDKKKCMNKSNITIISRKRAQLLVSLTIGCSGNSDVVVVCNCDLICSHVLISAIDQSVLLFSK